MTYIPALRAAQLLADAAGFLEGVPFTVVIDWVETADGELKTAILAQRELAVLCKNAGLDDIEAIYDEAINSIALAQTLSDAIKMLYIADYAPIAAGRIADSLARLVYGTGGRAAWAKLHTELRVSRSFVEPLSEHSKSARHGDRVYVPAQIVRLLADRSWTLISRYLAWKLNGPLDEVRFPQLVG